MARRVMRVLATGREIGAVEFDGTKLVLEGQAADILGVLRDKVGNDVRFGQDLMAGGWMNQAVELGPLVEGAGAPEAKKARGKATQVVRAAGHDTTLGHDELHHYWTKGEGLARWAESPKPWTTLVGLLTEHVGPEKAKVFASRWFFENFGFHSGSDKNRVAHGRPPRGHRVGPG